MISFILVPPAGVHCTKKNSMMIKRKGAQRFIGQNPRAIAAQQAMHIEAKRVLGSRVLFEGPIFLDLVFSFPKRVRDTDEMWGRAHLERPDVLNLAALVHDALEGVLYTDDAQVCGGDIRKIWGERCEVQCYAEPWETR